MILREEQYTIKMIGFLVSLLEPGKLLLYINLFMFVCMYICMYVFSPKKFMHVCSWFEIVSYFENFNIATLANAVDTATVAVVETFKTSTLPPQCNCRP